MTQRTTHPLVTAYLEELEHLLSGIDPAERAEVIAGVREHLEGALPGQGTASDTEVRAALAELGPAQAVADEAYADRPAPTPPAAARVGALSRPWVPVVVAVLSALGVLAVLLVAGAMPSIGTSSAADSSGTVTETVELTSPPLMGAAVAILVALPLWIPIAVLVGLSPLWTWREKLGMVLLVPAAAVLMGLLPTVGWWLASANGVYAGAWTALVLTLAGGGWLLVRLTRRAAGRARTPA